MILTEKVNTHFINLMEDKAFASFYFFNRDITEYNYERLEELKRKLSISKKRHQFLMNLISISRISDNLGKKVALSLEKENKRLVNYINQLDIFESNLSYLILSGKIEKIEDLGFSSDYIEKLLKSKKKELQESTTKYSYDETGRTSEYINNKLIILPYTPSVVRESIRKGK